VEAARPYSTEQFARRVEQCYVNAIAQKSAVPAFGNI